MAFFAHLALWLTKNYCKALLINRKFKMLTLAPLLRELLGVLGKRTRNEAGRNSGLKTKTGSRLVSVCPFFLDCPVRSDAEMEIVYVR